MEDSLELLVVAFCGVVLTFFVLFVGCWCIISCSFFCVKYIYCSNLTKLSSVLSLESSNSSCDTEQDLSDESDLEGEDYDAQLSHHHHHHPQHGRSTGGHHVHANQLEGYLVENAETGSTGMWKVTPEDVPPLYDFPPPYESLFNDGTEDDEQLVSHVVVVVNEVNRSSGVNVNTTTSLSPIIIPTFDPASTAGTKSLGTPV